LKFTALFSAAPEEAPSNQTGVANPILPTPISAHPNMQPT
jgi:hypothetical protein